MLISDEKLYPISIISVFTGHTKDNAAGMSVEQPLPPPPTYDEVYGSNQQALSQPDPSTCRVHSSDTPQQPQTHASGTTHLSSSQFMQQQAADNEPVERMQLKKPRSTSKSRGSLAGNIFMVVFLISVFIAGIVLTAIAGDNKVMAALGPACIVVPLIALIGITFFTLSMSSESRSVFQPITDAVQNCMGQGATDTNRST